MYKRGLLFAAVLGLAVTAAGCGGKTKNNTEDFEMNGRIYDFNMSQVRVTDTYCENALRLETEYLLSFEAGKWLAGFRETAGLDMQGFTRYGGWESSLIGGHSFGHYISACAQAYVNPGVSDTDKEKLMTMINELMDGLLVCQDNSKGKPGFIFAATLADRDNVEVQFDNVEMGRTNITTQAWVPWYTMHKLMAGLLDVYKYMDCEKALDIAEKLGDWVYDRAESWDNATRTRVLGIEYGGMNDCMYELYALTGEEKYAYAAHLFDEEALFKRVNSGEANVLNNRHANTTIPKFIGALNRYVTVNGKTICGEEVDAEVYLEYAESFFDTVVTHHSYITGGNSEWEHFGKDDILDSERTNCNNETCNTYNMLKLARMLYEITGDRKYADYYENAFYNSILSSQNPETGMTTYFQPMATGYFKVYGERYNKFWCCTGSGMENFTKLNDSIYFHGDNSIFVNMYLSSELVWEEKNLRLVQDSDIPEGNTSEFTVNVLKGKSVDTDIYFRIPDWAAGDVTVTVNGRKYEAADISGYACVSGEFADKTVIKITLPMQLTAYALPDNASAIAFKYGPVVLSAGLGSENMKTTTTGVNVTIPASKLVDSETIMLPAGVSRESFIENINTFMKKDSGALAFRIDGCELVFKPHYLKYNERYGIYWYFVTAKELEEQNAQKLRSEDTVIDTVQPGYGQYENDALHNMKESNTTGITNDGTSRYANENGYFTYRMAVRKTGNNYLSLTLKRADNGKTLLIKTGDTVLFSDTLDYMGKEQTYKLRVAVPAEIVKNAEKISANGEAYDVLPITFSGIDGAQSAKVCDFIYMLDVTPLYEIDKKTAYFVDCGDHDVTTVSDGDSFGIYNSVTEQLYGYDAVTGKKWGLIDNPEDQYGGAAISGALYTANTWAYEFDTSDGQDKEDTCRYTKNQYESGMATRCLDYYFELPDGLYTVEIGFSNPWNCSNMHNVYANLGTSQEICLASGFNVSGSPLVARVMVKGGSLTLNFRNSTSNGLAINVTYIKIY